MQSRTSDVRLDWVAALAITESPGLCSLPVRFPAAAHRAQQIEIAVEHRVEAAAAPAPLDVAHQGRAAAAIAADDGVDIAAGQQAGEFAVGLRRLRLLPGAGDD